MTRLTSLLLSFSAFALLYLTREGKPNATSTSIPTPTVSVPFKDGPTVTFQGTEITGRNGQDVDAFYGIPFGEEPERWRDPVMKAWDETTTTINVSNPYFLPCFQPNVGLDPNIVPSLVGENDCLKLNVWKPANATPSSDLPVMVFIHGGSLKAGGISTAADSLLIDGRVLTGQNLIDNTVVVTLQYRLGPLGFLGSEQLRNRSALNSTGNYGFLDQRLALQWVHENIHAFGGDAEKVFLFGESAGANSVSVHLISEASWPYISSAGMQSGAFSGYYRMNMTQANYNDLMKSVNCTSVDCLLNTSYETLYLQSNSGIGWQATIDGVMLTQNVTSALKSDSIAKVPMIMGDNLDEGTMAVDSGGEFGGLGPNMTRADLETIRCGLGANLYTNVTVKDGEKGNITTSLAEAFDFSNRGVPTPASTVNDILTKAYWEGVALTSAATKGCKTVSAAEDLSAISPIYVYELRAQVPVAPPVAGIHDKNLQPVAGSSGVPHGIDLFFVFPPAPIEASTVLPYLDMAPPDGFEEITDTQQKTLTATMSQAWINFAKTHDPGFGWQPWTKQEPSRAIFDYNTGPGSIENEKANHTVVQCELVDQFFSWC